MPYTKFHTDWQDKPSSSTPVTSAALEHIEEGIRVAHELAESGGAGIPAAEKGAPFGVAELDSGGQLVPDQLPDLAVTEYLGTSANQAAMLAKTGEPGDWTIREDLGTVWLITGDTPALLASWTPLSYPSAPVQSVAGKTGVVTLAKGDVGLGNVDNTSDANKPVSTAQQAALDQKVTIATAAELVRDTMGATLVAGANVDIVVNDAGDTITISADDPGTGGGGTAAPIFYPEDYGAAGDRVTVDTAAINACKAATLAAGGVMWLTEGREYRLDNTISYINEPCLIDGGGKLVQAPGYSVLHVRHEPSDTVTVTSLSTDVVGPGTSNDVSKPSNTVTRVNVSAAQLSKFQAGEAWLLRSQDTYAWSARPGGGSSSEYPVSGRVWMQDWAKILGVVMPFTTSGTWTIREGDTITGATSGATAQVVAHHTGVLVLRDITGTFTTTENLTVGGTQGGTVNGSAWVALNGRVDYSFATSPVIQRMRPDLPVKINIGLDSYSDPDDVLGSTARKDAIQVWGVIRPEVTVKSAGSYAAALQVATCFQPDVTVRVKRAPNIVVSGGSSSNIPTEGAYGYGVEALGAVAEGTFTVRATSVRHAFSTNPFEFSSSTYPSTVTNRLLTGIPRDNVVTGVAAECWSDGWNTHEGALRTIFKDCVNSRSNAGGRYQSGTKGFENRGIATKFLNCRDYGSTIGFWDSSMAHRIGGLLDETEYINCVAEDFQEVGFHESQAAYAGDVHRRRYFACRAKGNGVARPSSGPNTQKAFSLSGTDTELHSCKASRFNNDAVLISTAGTQTTAPTISILNFEVDYRDSPNTSSVNCIRVFGSNFRVVVGDVSVWQNTSVAGMPNHIVRATSGTPTILFAGASRTVNTDNPIPRYLTSSGTPTYGYTVGQQPRFTVAGTGPTDNITGDVWLDTTGTGAGTLKRWTGSAWA